MTRSRTTVWEDLYVFAPGRRYVPLLIAPVAAGIGLAALGVARSHPFGSFAGMSTRGGLAELVAGWALVIAGIAYSLRHRTNPFGYLLTGAGIAWFLPELANPYVGSAAAFAIGSIGFCACVPLIAHAASSYPSGRLRGWADRVAVTVTYVATLLLLGLLPTVVFDPIRAGCADCPPNPVLIRGDQGLFDRFNRYGLLIGLGAICACGVLLLRRLLASRALAGLLLPVLVPATAYLGLVAWDFAHAVGRGILGNDSFDRRTWQLEALALTAAAVGVSWGLLRERRARGAVARLVVEQGRIAQMHVRDALAAALGDRDLQLAYRRNGGGHVDASGRPVELGDAGARAVTPLLRGDEPVASLLHDARLLEQPGLLEEVLSAARVAVENERLQAEVLAQLEELRSSRTRIVESADAERRRLERDLHDGTQQRLLALSYDLRRAHSAADREGEETVAELLATAAGEAQLALEQLRQLAHGIYPAILGEGGLGPALATLADEAPLPVELTQAPGKRLPAPVERTAYIAVGVAIEDAAERAATHLVVAVKQKSGHLALSMADDGAPRPAPPVHLADRVGALGGTVHAEGTALEVEIPCA